MPNNNHNKSHPLDELDRQLLNRYQKAFPLSSTPFAEMAGELGLEQDALIGRLQRLMDGGYISRIGPVFRANCIGASTLAAMSVPQDSLATVAQIINEYEEVNHNYEREHEFNLWFVATAENQQQLDDLIRDIEQRTSIDVLILPMLEDYHIDLGFELQWNN